LENFYFEEIFQNVEMRFEQDCVNQIKQIDQKILQMEHYMIMMRMRFETTLQHF